MSLQKPRFLRKQVIILIFRHLDESRDFKWVPGESDKAKMIFPSRFLGWSEQINSNPFTFSRTHKEFWWRNDFCIGAHILFNEKVRIKNVILGLDVKPDDARSNDYFPIPELDDFGRFQPNVSENNMHQNLR